MPEEAELIPETDLEGIGQRDDSASEAEPGSEGPEQASHDGYWHWYADEGGIQLVVWPAAGVGRKVPEAGVRQELSAAGLKGVDWNKVAATVRTGKGEPVWISPPQDSPIGTVSRIQVHLSKDRQRAYVRVFPGQDLPTEHVVTSALERAGVTRGIDSDAVMQAAQIADPHVPVLVASGREAVPGLDASVDFLFKTDGVYKPVELEDGRVDFYNLNIVENAEQGQVLAVKTPATHGEPGFLVTGEDLPAKPGRGIQLTAGNCVELSEDGTTLRAMSAGHVCRVGTYKVSVYPVYEVKGDVGLATGNINFVGTVVVGGNVKDGTTIVAEKDVRVDGHVDGATIKAGGHVAIRRGIQGKNRSTIIAKGDVTAMFVENGDITAEGSVHVGEAVMHSKISAGRRVTVEGRKGLIVGGKVRARDEVVATVVGSPLGTTTELEVGVDPSVRVEFSQGTAELKRLQHEVDQAKKNAERFKAQVNAGRVLTQSRQEQYLKLLASQSGYKRRAAELERRMAELQREMSESEYGRIKVKQQVYPGVRMTIGYQSLHVRDVLPAGAFHLIEGDIKLLTSQ